ncbi:hypothetical protein GCM10009849_12480 [Sinomonas flava]|uniref:SAF domain-containing protein n=1 Tax=Sinomonas flava TaxID=496857 RepID=A0ABN3BP60_9MICC
MRTRLLGGVAALIVAIIGTVLLITYVNGADARALANTETSDVYVVQKAVPAGTPSASLGDAIAKKPIPKGVTAVDAVSDLGDLQGRVAAVDLQPGEQLLATRFVEPAELRGPSRAEVPAGMQEVTVRLPIERVVGGTVSAGDTVGVFLSFAKEDAASAQTQLTYHKVLVTGFQMASGANAESPQNQQSGQSSGGINSNRSAANNGEYLVTLAVPAAQAERIVFTTEFGKVYLSKEPKNAAEDSAGVVDRTKVFR